MRPFARTLEDFGDPDAGRENEAESKLKAAAAAARGEGHAAGYAEGFAAALAQADTEDRRMVAQILEAVRDLELQMTAARAEAIDGLRPVIEAIIRAAAPMAASRGLAEEVAAAVTAHLDTTRSESLVLRVAPDRIEDLRHRLEDSVAITPDPMLGPITAQLEWAGGGTVFDAEGCLDAATHAIESFFGSANEERLRDAG
jgi:flagellar biosynthesis/type III secretory pathway protein FliH